MLVFYVNLLHKNRNHMKNTLYSWFSILIGCIILAAGFVFFINPYNIVPGGVYGASIVLHNYFLQFR